MQLANEQVSLELLGLSKSASAQDIRDAYIALCRMWHPKAIEKWKEWGVEPNHDFIGKIYHAIKTAFLTLNYPNSKKELIVPLDETLLSYKKTCETLLMEKSSKPLKGTAVDDVLEIWRWPSDLIALFASFFGYKELANFASTSIRNYKIAKLVWPQWGQIFIRQGNYNKFLKFSERNTTFSISDLGMEFGEIQEPTEEDLSYFHSVNHRLDILCKTGKQPTLQLHRMRHTTEKDFFVFLQANMSDLFLKPKLILEIFCKEDFRYQLVLKFLVGKKFTVLEVLTSLPFSNALFNFLTRSVKDKALLPAPVKTRENFESTCKYFEYLISNIHDLYITLCLDPNLINIQDENGQTLLFYPAKGGSYFSERHLQWLAAILSQIPNVNLDIVDNELNDTFLHYTLARFNIGDELVHPKANFVFNFFEPVVKLALTKHFNFRKLNKNHKSILDLAATLFVPGKSPLRILLRLREWAIYEGLPLNNLPDPDQCTKNSNAFSKALESHGVINAECLLDVTNFSDLLLKENLLRLQCLIYDQYRNLSKCEIPCEEKMGTVEYYAAMNAMQQVFVDVRRWQRLFIDMIAILDMDKVCKNSRDVAWLTHAMVLRLIKEISGNNTFASFFASSKSDTSIKLIAILKNEEVDLQTKERALFKYLGSYPDNTISVIARKVFEDELKNIFKNVYSYSRLIVENFTPIVSIGYLRALLAAKLVRTENLLSNNCTQELAKYFNEITHDASMKDCEELFHFLLIYRDGVINSLSIWETPNKSQINWQQLIQIIRDSALEKVKSTNAAMGYQQAVEYLTVCRDYLIFSLPNTFRDNLGLRTYAVSVIDELKQQRIQERLAGESNKIRFT